MSEVVAIFVQLLENIGLISLIILAYGTTQARLFKQSPTIQSVVLGLIFAVSAVVSMLIPFALESGVFADARGPILALSGYFGGPLSALISAVAAILFRLLRGGVGAIPGVGAIIVNSFIGVAARALFFRGGRSRRTLFVVLGVVVAVNTIAWYFLLPYPMSIESVRLALIPLGVTFPIATFALAMLMQDRYERFNMRTRLKELEDTYGRLVDNLPLTVILKDRETRYVACNSSFASEIGVTASAIKGSQDSDFFPEDLARKYKTDDLAVIESGIASEFDEEHCAHGSRIWVHSVKTPIKDRSGNVEGLLVLYWDVTERRKMEEEVQRSASAVRRMNEELELRVAERTKSLAEAKEELERVNVKLSELSTLDELTGLSNRRRFNELYELEWGMCLRDSAPLSIIMIDIDFFKNYNDLYGHPRGDECLRLVARAISSSVSRQGDVVARYGGEEFIVVLPKATEQGARVIAEAIRRNVERLAIAHEGSTVSDCVTVSLGYSSIVPSREVLPSSVIATADDALYDSKREGRNRIASRYLSASTRSA